MQHQTSKSRSERSVWSFKQYPGNFQLFPVCPAARWPPLFAILLLFTMAKLFDFSYSQASIWRHLAYFAQTASPEVSWCAQAKWKHSGGFGRLPLSRRRQEPSRRPPPGQAPLLRSPGLLPELSSRSSSWGPRTSHGSRSDESRAPSSRSTSGRQIPSLHKYFGNRQRWERKRRSVQSVRNSLHADAPSRASWRAAGLGSALATPVAAASPVLSPVSSPGKRRSGLGTGCGAMLPREPSSA